MIEGQAITRTFAARRGMLGRGGVRALRGVDFTIPDRGAVSFIGESGCGKTTLGRILCGLESFDGGDLIIGDQPMAGLKPRQRAPYHRRIQMIHQDPYSALNPTRTIGQILAAPLALRAKQVGADPGWLERRRAELLGLVGLDPSYVLPRYPHMLSGGMRQRVVIARALTVDPDVLVADEAVSMIDVSLRLGILQLLRDLRDALRRPRRSALCDLPGLGGRAGRHRHGHPAPGPPVHAMPAVGHPGDAGHRAPRPGAGGADRFAR